MPGLGTFTNSPTSFTELVTTTWRKHRTEIKDNVSTRNALLKYIMKRGNYRKEDGGLSIVTPLDYTTNGTYQRYSDWDLLNIAQSDVISAAEYPWRQISLSVVASGRDIRVNSGESAIIKLVKARIKNAIRTFNNNFSQDLYSDGTASNQINGLQAIISDATTGTVGGINSSTYTFWKSQRYRAQDNSVTVSATTMENGMMLPLWLLLDRGPDDQPDLIVMSNNYYTFFEGSQVSLKRYNDKASADGGFITLKYKNADVLFDGGAGIPTSRGYFINTNYLELVVHRDADLEVMDDVRPVNQDGSVTPILWMGNLTCSNRNQQGLNEA